MNENTTYTSNVFSRNLKAYNNKKISYIVDQGGTWSTKTYSILQLLHQIAIRSKKPKLISIVAESIPHLKRGAIRDFEKIIGPGFNFNDRNKSDMTYQFGNSTIEFFSADNPGKVHGPRRDILMLNEANNIPWPIAKQLFLRTRQKIFIDYNPVSEFWAHTEIIPMKETAFIHSTYLDGLDFIPKRILETEILAMKDKDPNWWKVYGLGEVGTLDGLIYKFELIDEYPKNIDRERIGLDWGYSNDPTTAIKVGLVGDTLYLDELVYEKGLQNNILSQRLLDAGLRKGYDHIIADNEDPKSIDDLSGMDWWIEPCIKGAGSLMAGINKVKEFKLMVTKRSLNLIKELRNYQWAVDKLTGKSLNKPIDKWNHGCDAARYGLTDMTNGVEAQITVF
jgi:phage terminase large subunit